MLSGYFVAWCSISLQVVCGQKAENASCFVDKFPLFIPKLFPNLYINFNNIVAGILLLR
jgi:hypothetical protein